MSEEKENKSPENPNKKKPKKKHFQKGLTPYQGKKKCVGIFKCNSCENEWVSVHSWANMGQECYNCQIKVYPFKQLRSKSPAGTNKASQSQHTTTNTTYQSQPATSTALQLQPKILPSRPIPTVIYSSQPIEEDAIQFEKGQSYFGAYRCTKCNRRWMSANSWLDFGQECKKCHISVLPYKLAHLDEPEGLDVSNPNKNHPQELCGKCKELKFRCTKLKDGSKRKR